ncbi:hypothetical protein L1887_29024 [Cichorium endivia]|nr:hypothetical protein L1887_29024 [Cichorium endivia]
MAGDKDGGKKEEDGGSHYGSDHNSPYYIHASDYPRQLHVNDVLTDGNYLDWSQEMLNFLFAKNKVGFINGSIKKPESDAADYMAWMRCDAMIKGWLNTAMEKEIRTSVKYASTSQEIWADLKERFGKESAPRAYELKQSLSSIRQDGLSVSAYYTKLRGLWDEIQSVLPTPTCGCGGCTCNLGKKLAKIKDKEKLYEFLLGLDSDFGTIRTQILAMQPIPTLGTAYHLVADDEQQRVVSGGKKPNQNSTAFQALVPGKREHTKSQDKNWRRDPKRNSGDGTEQCDFRGKGGHNRDGCFKRIGYPDWWPGKGKQNKPKAACVEGDSSPITGLSEEQYKQFLKLFGNKEGSKKEENASIANMAGFDHEGLDWNGSE